MYTTYSTQTKVDVNDTQVIHFTDNLCLQTIEVWFGRQPGKFSFHQSSFPHHIHACCDCTKRPEYIQGNPVLETQPTKFTICMISTFLLRMYTKRPQMQGNGV